MPYFDGLDDHETERPPIAGESDAEYETRIQAARVRAEWRCPLTATAPQRSLESLPLFATGREEQGGLFE